MRGSRRGGSPKGREEDRKKDLEGHIRLDVKSPARRRELTRPLAQREQW